MNPLGDRDQAYMLTHLQDVEKGKVEVSYSCPTLSESIANPFSPANFGGDRTTMGATTFEITTL